MARAWNTPSQNRARSGQCADADGHLFFNTRGLGAWQLAEEHRLALERQAEEHRLALNERQSWTWQMEPALWATRYAMSEPALQVLESECLEVNVRHSPAAFGYASAGTLPSTPALILTTVYQPASGSRRLLLVALGRLNATWWQMVLTRGPYLRGAQRRQPHADPSLRGSGCSQQAAGSWNLEMRRKRTRASLLRLARSWHHAGDRCVCCDWCRSAWRPPMTPYLPTMRVAQPLRNKACLRGLTSAEPRGIKVVRAPARTEKATLNTRPVSPSQHRTAEMRRHPRCDETMARP